MRRPSLDQQAVEVEEVLRAEADDPFPVVLGFQFEDRPLDRPPEAAPDRRLGLYAASAGAGSSSTAALPRPSANRTILADTWTKGP